LYTGFSTEIVDKKCSTTMFHIELQGAKDMPRGTQRCRVDENQSAIVSVFRKAGCSVFPTHSVGKGFPDLVLGFNGWNVLVEVKDGSKSPSKQKLTADELAFFHTWKGTVHIVTCDSEAIALVNKYRSHLRLHP